MTTYRSNRYFQNEHFPFFMNRYLIRSNETIPAHGHEFVELVYVIRGGARHELAGHIYELADGDVFVIEPQVTHSYTGGPRDDSLVYNVLFHRELLDGEMAAIHRLPSFLDFFYLVPFLRKDVGFIPYHPLSPFQRMQVEGNLDAIYREYTEKADGFELIVKTRLIECLVLLSRFHKERDTVAFITGKDRERIGAIARFVEQHYQQPMTLEQLSRACGMSVSSFTAKFKEATGKTLIDYRQSVQIRKACSLLEDPSRKVLDVALESGFQDVSFFNRMFKKHTGLTPREYRAQREKDA